MFYRTLAIADVGIASPTRFPADLAAERRTVDTGRSMTYPNILLLEPSASRFDDRGKTFAPQSATATSRSSLAARRRLPRPEPLKKALIAILAFAIAIGLMSGVAYLFSTRGQALAPHAVAERVHGIGAAT